LLNYQGSPALLLKTIACDVRFSISGTRSLTLSLMVLVFLSALRGSASSTFIIKDRTAPLRVDEASIEEGDIVFRRGIGMASDFVVSLDTGSRYSHVGIVCKRDGHLFVIHILPDEQNGTDDCVRMDPLEVFLSTDNASRYVLCRLSGGRREISRKAVEYAMALWREGVRYDYDLDATNARCLYCSELVWIAYKRAGVDLIDGVLDRANLPFYQGRYVMISRLFSSRWLQRNDRTIQ
jgi:hypothetical protein